MQCERPGCTNQNAEEHPSMTCYVDKDGVPTDELNPRPILCPEHWEEYREYWQEMWDEYHNSLL